MCIYSVTKRRFIVLIFNWVVGIKENKITNYITIEKKIVYIDTFLTYDQVVAITKTLLICITPGRIHFFTRGYSHF